MHLTHCVVHEIEKAAGESSARAHYSEVLMPITDDLSSLVDKLTRRFNGSRLVNARFDESPGKLFPQKFRDYADGISSDEAFLEYTRQVVGHLETVIQGKSGAKGGYLLLCAYADAEGSAHGVFLLRNTVGRIFRRRADGFDIEPVVHLDTEQLAMACRIDVGRFRQNTSTYLQLTHRTEQEVSAYFTDWIGAEETLSNRAMTASLQELLGSIEHVDEVSGEAISQAQTYERAYEHVRASPSKVVDIQALSEELYGSPARIETAAREQGIELETEFRYNPSALKELVQMKASADGIDLRFARTALEDGLIYVEEDDKGRMRIVIESDALARRVLGQ